MPAPLHAPSVCRPAAFKKSASPDVSKAVGPLLKAYQEEIDRLTSRAKAGEAAFLDVYQKLYEAPNPAPALSAGLVSRGVVGRIWRGSHTCPMRPKDCLAADGRCSCLYYLTIHLASSFA